MADRLDRLEAGREVIAAKDAKGMSWQQLADTLERALVWTPSALLGQQPHDAEHAQKILPGVRARAGPGGRPGQAHLERQVPALQGVVTRGSTRRRVVGLTRPVRG